MDNQSEEEVNWISKLPRRVWSFLFSFLAVSDLLNLGLKTNSFFSFKKNIDRKNKSSGFKER